MVYDSDDTRHGEISILESAHKAARLVETLLEAGFGQDRIRIFNGDEMGMQVTHRPVVALVNNEASDQSDQAAAGADEQAEEQRELEEAATRPRSEPREAVAAAPFSRDGIRFSSLFRPA